MTFLLLLSILSLVYIPKHIHYYSNLMIGRKTGSTLFCYFFCQMSKYFVKIHRICVSCQIFEHVPV